MHKRRGPQKYPLKTLKYLSPLMFFWPSVKEHRHIAEEMPQILASGFVSLYFFGIVTTVGLFFPWIFFSQYSQHRLFTQAGKDSREAKSNMFLSALCGGAWLNGLLFQREPRTKKQTNGIPHKHKFCIKLDIYCNAHKCIWMYSKLAAVNAVLFLSLCPCAKATSSACSFWIFI